MVIPIQNHISIIPLVLQYSINVFTFTSQSPTTWTLNRTEKQNRTDRTETEQNRTDRTEKQTGGQTERHDILTGRQMG